ncbi:MAG: prolyl oligopeptidase family serine peptidase [Rubrivivax sp.]|nr:prolyl oligopeptidase family serine peptidase [Rubrivivax sp.]
MNRRKFLGAIACPLPMTPMTTLHAQQTTPSTPPSEDPYLWLEDVQGERALAWVRERNAQARERLQAWPDFMPLRQRIREVLDSRDRIPAMRRRGEAFYNLWQDATNPRGLWRRTSLAEYRKAQPAWETVLDVDALGKAEGVNWVWGGSNSFGPVHRRSMLKLSKGGADAAVQREFDTVTKRFVQASEGGFELPEAKSSFDWIDADSAYIGTDFGPGSMTDSGYPRVIKRWQRGQRWQDAVTVFEGQQSDVAAWASVDRTPGFERTLFGRSIDFYRTETFLLQDGQLRRIPKPDDAELAFWREWALVSLRSPWTVDGRIWPTGALLVCSASSLLEGKPSLKALFTPTATRSLQGYQITRSRLLLSVLHNVAGRVEEVWRGTDASWQRREVATPFPGTVGIEALHDPLLKDDPLGEAWLLSYTDFLTPDTLSLAYTGSQTGSDRFERLKARPSEFDATGMRTEQRFATSKDGTRIPYFVVWPKGAQADGRNPTLLYGYGGFEVSLQPWYSGVFGKAWTARGGVLVVANIRGGGEFGPAWHQAATQENKQRSYDDFAAVAEDLIRQRITSPAHLGMQGGSNGGLLVGAVMLQRPELFGAVVCSVPLLDMKRYHQLLAGASWMAEYGDPDQPEQWAWISRYSPYQNVRSGMKLPAVLFTTSTRDDRVHPGHARKMAARMLEQGHDATYYENIEGGHGGAADNAQRADLQALEFAFLWQRLVPRARIPEKPKGEALR